MHKQDKVLEGLTMATKSYEIKDIQLAPLGKEKIDLASIDMPVLGQIRQYFERGKPLRNMRIACCLHVTRERANLMRTLKAGGAEVALCSCNSQSTKNDVAASLVADFDVPVFVIKGADHDTSFKHIRQALNHKPHITMDDGCDLIDWTFDN